MNLVDHYQELDDDEIEFIQKLWKSETGETVPLGTVPFLDMERTLEILRRLFKSKSRLHRQKTDRLKIDTDNGMIIALVSPHGSISRTEHRLRQLEAKLTGFLDDKA